MKRVAMLAACSVTVVALEACGSRVTIGEIVSDPSVDSGTNEGLNEPPILGFPTGSTPDVEADPCRGKACGEACKRCELDEPCVNPAAHYVCDGDGKCVSEQPSCLGHATGGYVPCARKECGQRCTICDPAASDCFESTDLKVCTKAGVCMATSAPGC